MKSKRKDSAGLLALVLALAATVGAEEANLEWKYDASARSVPTAVAATGTAQTAEAWRSVAVSEGGLCYNGMLIIIR